MSDQPTAAVIEAARDVLKQARFANQLTETGTCAAFVVPHAVMCRLDEVLNAYQPASPPEPASEPEPVDLSGAKVGDVCVLRDGDKQPFKGSTPDNYDTKETHPYMAGAQSYRQDGSWSIWPGEESTFDIVRLIRRETAETSTENPNGGIAVDHSGGCHGGFVHCGLDEGIPGVSAEPAAAVEQAGREDLLAIAEDICSFPYHDGKPVPETVRLILAQYMTKPVPAAAPASHSEPPKSAEGENMPCGHHASLKVSSVESDYTFCELCEARNRQRDAENHERELVLENRQLKNELILLKDRNERGRTGWRLAKEANEAAQRYIAILEGEALNSPPSTDSSTDVTRPQTASELDTGMPASTPEQAEAFMDHAATLPPVNVSGLDDSSAGPADGERHCRTCESSEDYCQCDSPDLVPDQAKCVACLKMCSGGGVYDTNGDYYCEACSSLSPPPAPLVNAEQLIRHLDDLVEYAGECAVVRSQGKPEPEIPRHAPAAIPPTTEELMAWSEHSEIPAALRDQPQAERSFDSPPRRAGRAVIDAALAETGDADVEHT